MTSIQGIGSGCPPWLKVETLKAENRNGLTSRGGNADAEGQSLPAQWRAKIDWVTACISRISDFALGDYMAL